MARKQATPSPQVDLVQIWPAYLGHAGAITERFSFLCRADVATSTLGEWQLDFTVRVVDRQLFISELTVRPVLGVTTWPDGRLSVSLLRSLPLEPLLSAVRVWVETDGRPRGDRATTRELRDSPSFLEWHAARPEFMRALNAVNVSGRGRPRLRSDEELRSVAEEAIALGQTVGRGWQKELARRRGELAPDGITVRQPIKDAMRICRTDLQYLEPTERGSQAAPRPGRQLLVLWKRERDPRYDEWMSRMLIIEEDRS